MPQPLDAATLHSLLESNPEPTQAAAWIGALLGPVHRLAWQGKDPAGHRGRSLERLQLLVSACQGGDPHQQRLATLVDWWLHVLLGKAVLGQAFHVEAVIDDPDLREPLSRLAHRGPTALAQRHRPLAFQQAIRELDEVLQAIPTIKKAPGPELYGEAREQAHTLLNLARERRPRGELPDLHLFTADVQAWASEERGGQALTPQLKVWNSVVKHLGALQARCQRLRETWTTDEVEPARLPADWPERIAALGGPYGALLPALLADLALLDGPVPAGVQAPLQPDWTLDLLAAAEPGLPEPLRVRLLGVHEEARALSNRPEPAWVAATQARLDELRLQVRSLREEAAASGATEAESTLDEALDQLQRFELGECEEWIRLAEEELGGRRRDEEESARARELAQRVATLAELDVQGTDPRPGESSAARLDRLEGMLGQARDDLARQLQQLRAAPLPPSPLRQPITDRLDEAARSLERRLLPGAARALRQAEEQLAAWRSSEQRRLLPAAIELREQAASARLREEEREGLVALAERVALRAAEGLPFQDLLEAGQALLRAAATETLDELPVLLLVGETSALERQRPVRVLAWADSGVKIAAQRLPPRQLYLPADPSEGLDQDSLRIARCRAGWVGPDGRTLALDGPLRPPPDGQWHDAITVRTVSPISREELQVYPGAHDLSDTIFLVLGQEVLGPYRTQDEDGLPRPADPRGFVGQLEREAFDALFGTLHVRFAVEKPGRLLVHRPPDLDSMLAQDAAPVDQLDPLHLQVWLADLARDLSPALVERLASAVAALQGQGASLPPELLRQRLSALGEALRSARAFEQERIEAVDGFLRTEQAGALLESKARARVEDLVARHANEIEARRAAQELALQELDARLEQRREELGALDAAIESERGRLQARAADLQAEVDALQSLARDRRAHLLIELFGAAHPTSPAQGAAATPAATPAAAPAPEAPRAAAFPAQAPPPLAELVADLQRQMPTWKSEEVANLLLSLLVNRWTLLAGPPGVGKSTFTRALLTALGHGRGTDRYLELVVRHEWQDDAPLFGFWHPERNAWVPSSEGFVEQLQRAAHDLEQGHGGLYPLLFEELNLAAPEHYLARPISAFEDEHPRIRLYGADSRPHNAAQYPATIPVGDNVRLLGTVNVDDTVQRLSPRFLSRVNVIWVEPSKESLFQPAVRPTPPEQAFSWSALLDRVPPGVSDLPVQVRRVVELLYERRFQGAPSPRVLRGVERFLAASRGVLTPLDAADLQVSQRILPAIRGVGPELRGRLDELASLLRTVQLPRSAERVQRLRERGEALGDFYDMFHV